LYGTLLGSCLVAILGAQALINTAVVVGWSPPKGLVLPLTSYGPSAAIVHVAMIALLLKIGVETQPVPQRRDAEPA
jgi:cell division protein FtsW